MGNFLNRESIRFIVLFLMTAALLALCVWGVVNGDHREPDNPMSGSPARSMVELGPALAEDTLSGLLGKASGTGSGTEQNDLNLRGGGSDADPSDVWTGEEAEAYFTTTIQDGETVTVPAYSFRIRHLNPELTVFGERVSVNQNTLSAFNGLVTLKEGTNSITIRVTYERATGETFTASRSYTVYLNTQDIIFRTSLIDGQEVYEQALTFTASGEKGGSPVALKVVVGGETLSSQTGAYTATLSRGENTITLTAGTGSEKRSVSYRVSYVFDDNLSIDTDLLDRTVSERELSFYAYAIGGAGVSLEASINGTKLSGTNGQYTVTLNAGENTLQLVAKDQRHPEEIKQTYTVTYAAEQGAGPDISDENGPTFNISVDGKTNPTKIEVGNNQINLDVTDARDQDGNNLTAGNVIIISYSSATYSKIYENPGKISYFIQNISEGDNEIQVLLTDGKGRRTSRTITITYRQSDPNTPIGTITFSLEASTIGINLIAPMTIDIYTGDTGAVVLEQVLAQYGYTTTHEGTAYSGYYLKAIQKPGLLLNPAPSIPADLKALLEEHANKFDADHYHVGSLGADDFTSGSGWMYSVNGVCKNYGLNDYVPADGDILRIRFTTYLGHDIMGSGGLGEEGDWGDW